MEIVELAALLHDVDDWKYSGSDTAGLSKATAFLQAQHYPAERIAFVVDTIQNVSFKNELAAGAKTFSKECKVVQDADRLVR